VGRVTASGQVNVIFLVNDQLIYVQNDFRSW